MNKKKKEDADRFLESVKEKSKTAREIHLKGFHIANLYIQANEYRTALRHVQDYIGIKPTDVRAYRLLGEIYEVLKDTQKAIDTYRRALELNDTQKDLVLKVAELYCLVNCDSERHRFWAERAEKYFPGTAKIYSIMEHIYRKSGKLINFRTYLQQKLKSRPQDLTLNLKLLQVLIDLQKLQEGKQLCKQVEGARLFDNEKQWWQKAFQLYQTLLSNIDEGDQSLDHITTFCHSLLAINKLVLITLSVPITAVAQASKLLRIMDRELFRATDYIDASPPCPQQSSAQIVLQEIKAQLYTHLATLIIKMCATGSARWTDVIGPVTACYLVSAQIPSCQEPKTTDGKGRSLDSRVYSLAQCRLSEVCHILNSLVKQQKDNNWLKQCHDRWCSEEGRHQLLSQAFGQAGLDPTCSYLMLDHSLVSASFTALPNLIKTVFGYDQDSIKSDPCSLPRLVWLGLRWDIRQDSILPDLGQFLQPIFSRLLFSTKHLENTSVDNIRLLDIEAFLYSCVHVAKLQQEQLRARGQALPQTLPLGLCRGMCGQQQLEWYSALCCLYSAKASPSERAKLRLIVQKGLEVLRCRLNHGMETMLLIRLGRTFRERMQEVQKASDGDDKREQWNAFQEMSILYWQAAMEHLNLLERNQAVPMQQKPFFTHSNRPILADKIHEYKDEGTVAIAEFKFQQGQFQQAVAMLDKTKSATGSYLKAQMYMTKAKTEAETQGLVVSSSPLTRQGELLDKAKYALFQTMDFIQDRPDNPLHDEIQTSLSDIDNRQASLCQEVVQLDQEESAAGDTSYRSLNNSRNISGFSDQLPVESVGTDPSPRRLAAELRSLNLSHGRLMEENAQLRSLAATHSRILEQNQLLIEKQNTLMESNNALMKQVLELNMKFQELSAAQSKKPTTPPPAPLAQPQNLPDHINSNRPIIISAQECNPNLSTPQVGSIYPMMAHGGLASPMPGIASPMHTIPTAQLPGLYHQPVYGYYTTPQGYGIAAYDSSGLHPGLISSTPAMHANRMPVASQFMMYDDVTSPTEVEVETTAADGYAHGMEPKPETKPTALLTGKTYPQGMTTSVFTDSSSAPVAPEEMNVSLPTSTTAASRKPVNGIPAASLQPTPTLSRSKDIVGTSPLLMSMLMNKDEDSTGSPSTKLGSITAGTSPKSSSTKSYAIPSTAVTKPKTQEANQTQQGPLATSKSPESGNIFTSASKPSSVAPFQAAKLSDKMTNPTAATVSASPSSTPNSASSVLSSFSFKTNQLAASGNTQQKPSPAPQASAVTASVSQSPFAGFTFGQIKPPNTMATTFGNLGSDEVLSFTTVAHTDKGQQKEEWEVDDENDDDEVIFVSEKIPTPEQRARAIKLMLPPTYFLYEDEPPCPGCIGCDPEDLAARGITLNKHCPSPKASRAKEKGSTGSVAPETSGAFAADEPSQTTSTIFGTSGTSTVSFASLSSDKQGTFAQPGQKGFSFAKAGAPVFGNKGNEESSADGQEHDPHFDPIVELPELIDVRTGEEDEEVMYKQRARLYRFAKELGVWKERGIGDVKLLRHKDTGLLRLIMRREQVLKLCANHRISTDLKLNSMESSDRTWVWYATDYAEGEPCHEQFAIKFKTPELATEYKQRFEELQALRREEERMATVSSEKEEEFEIPKAAEIEEKTDAKEGVEESVKTPAVEETDQAENIEDILAKFQPKPGDWKCDTCWLNNKEDAMSCIACMTPKPGAPPSSFSSKVPTSQETGSGNLVDLSSGGGFTFGTSSFGSSKTPGFQFGGPLPFGSTTSIPSAPQFALPSGAVKFGSTQSESAPATTTEQTPTTSHPTSRFIFGAAFQKFDLGGSGDKALQPVFGSHSPSAGFTFASSVISAKTEAAGSNENTVSSQAQQVTPVKPPTGFVFGAGTPTSSTQPSMEKPKGYSFVDMAKSQGSTFSFRLDVSKTTEASPEKTPKPKSPGFLKSPGLNKSADNEYYKDDDGDHIHFEPVVELPECITVKTGEEDEISKFSHRAKLFRFDKDSSQWKERGIGDIKLLYNPSNGKYRIVMRREQVLKVCANHYITPELKLEPNAGSTKSWVWMAMDASDDEVQVEQLAVRFKTDEAAQQFKEAIDAAQEDMKTGAKEMPKEAKQDDGEKIKERLEEGQSDLTAGVSKEDRDKSAVDFDLGEGAAEEKNDQDGFANYIGDQDYDEDDEDDVDDDEDDDNYIEQDTVEDPNVVVTKIGQDDEDFNQDRDALEGQDNTVPKGTAEAEYSDQDEDDGLKDVDKDVVEEEQDTVENPNLVVTETGQNDEDIGQDRDTLEGQDSTVPKGTAEAECSDKDDESYENVEGEQVDTGGGQADKESKIGGDGPEAEAEVGEQDDNQGYDVNEEEKVVHKKEPTKAAEDEKPFVAKSCDPNISKAFSELLRSANTSHSQKQKEATESSSQKEQEEGAGSSKDDCVSGGDDIHFEPVAYLPLQVEKITGEEDENQLFCSRAKLYRYDKESLQWKDRGIGDIKILHNPKTMRYRIVMRREQVLKLCANHYITKEMSLLPNAGSENSLVWNAMDASDGDIQPQQLAVRFKLAGTTQRFKAVFEECQAELRKATDQAGDDSSSTDPPKPDDVET